MFCIACHTEWNVPFPEVRHIRHCPVCRNPLHAPDRKDLENVLLELAFRQGRKLLSDGKALLAAFSALAPRMAREKLMLAGLIACGGHAILLESADLDETAKAYVAESVMALMADQGFFSMSAASIAVHAYLSAASALMPGDPLDADTHFHRATDFLNGINIHGHLIPINRRVGHYHLHRAADLGNPMAQTMVADRYRAGFDRYPEDVDKAVHYYTLAADQGYADAQVTLAFLCDSGDGVPKDPERYFYWMKKAAEQEHPSAMLFLGFAYANGTGTPECRDKAEYWLKKAADQDENHEIAVWAREQLSLLSACK